MKKLFLLILLLIFVVSIGFIFKDGGYSPLSLVCAIIASASLISCTIIISNSKEE